MTTLKLTKKDFKQSDGYWKDYIGKEDLSDFDGNLEIESDLGWCKFNSLKVKGYIFVKAGSGIEAGWGIKAGDGIEAGSGIKAGLSITCKLSISWTYKIFSGICYWRDIDDSEKTITCGKLEPKNKAVVEYGIVKELGLPEEESDDVEIIVDGNKKVISRKSAIALNLIN